MARTITEQLDNLYTTTWQNMKEEVADNVFSGSAFWFWLQDKGKIKPTSGGRYLTEPIQYDTNNNTTWLKKGGTTPLNDYEFLTTGKYDWKYVAIPIVRFGVDDQQNRGKNEILSLLDAKLANTKNSLISAFETALVGGINFSTDGDEADKVFGLRDLVDDDPTQSRTYKVAEIDQSTYSWWRNQVTSGTLTTSNIITNMRALLFKCMNNLKMDAPDIIMADETMYSMYDDVCIAQKRIVNQKLADAGFDNITFRGIPIVWIPQLLAKRMYFLNTNYLYLQYDPQMYFDMTEWKPIPAQVNDRVAQIATACNLTVSRRKCQGVLIDD